MHSGGITGVSVHGGNDLSVSVVAETPDQQSLIDEREDKREEKPKKSRVAKSDEMVQVDPSDMLSVDLQIGDVVLPPLKR